MKEIQIAVMSIIVIAVASFIGLGLMEMTHDTVGDAVSNTTLLDDVRGDIGDVFTTLTSLLPMLVLAIVGGLALFYVIQYVGGAAR